jgi:hypothetical protein
MIHALMARARLSRYAQRPESRSKVRKCAQAMAAACGVPSSAAMLASVGCASVGSSVAALGRTRMA